MSESESPAPAPVVNGKLRENVSTASGSYEDQNNTAKKPEAGRLDKKAPSPLEEKHGKDSSAPTVDNVTQYGSGQQGNGVVAGPSYHQQLHSSPGSDGVLQGPTLCSHSGPAAGRAPQQPQVGGTQIKAEEKDTVALVEEADVVALVSATDVVPSRSTSGSGDTVCAGKLGCATLDPPPVGSESGHFQADSFCQTPFVIL